MTVHFLDVGQGDSALIQYNGTNILIDAGEGDEGQAIVTYLKHQGVSDIDLLIATHPHSDHIGGMQDILKNFNVRSVIDSGMPHTTTTYQKFLETINAKNIPYSTVRPGDSFSPAPGVDNAGPFSARTGVKTRISTKGQLYSEPRMGV